MKALFLCFCLLLGAGMLVHPSLSLYYALNGLMMWFEKMIPTLLPFMILSGWMIRCNLTQHLVKYIYRPIRKIFRISPDACYAMIIGFLCGFPMGAKTISELLERKKISQTEASYLLGFCNNIGPIYFVGFVLPLLERKAVLPYLFGMYGLSLLYGLLLRITRYRKCDREFMQHYELLPTNSEPLSWHEILGHLDDSVTAAIHSILMLGGYMIFFQLLNLIPHMITGKPPVYISPFLEITGGISRLGNAFPLFTLLLLPFGGLCCLAQTFHCVQGSGLSMIRYILDKVNLTALTALYYWLWYISSSSSFLR